MCVCMYVCIKVGFKVGPVRFGSLGARSDLYRVGLLFLLWGCECVSCFVISLRGEGGGYLGVIYYMNV